jgi:hypothetical protein
VSDSVEERSEPDIYIHTYIYTYIHTYIHTIVTFYITLQIFSCLIRMFLVYLSTALVFGCYKNCNQFGIP